MNQWGHQTALIRFRLRQHITPGLANAANTCFPSHPAAILHYIGHDNGQSIRDRQICRVILQGDTGKQLLLDWHLHGSRPAWSMGRTVAVVLGSRNTALILPLSHCNVADEGCTGASSSSKSAFFPSSHRHKSLLEPHVEEVTACPKIFLVKIVYRQTAHSHVLQALGKTSRRQWLPDVFAQARNDMIFTFLTLAAQIAPLGLRKNERVIHVAHILEGLHALALGLC